MNRQKAYDMHGPWEPQTDNHAPLYKRSWDTDITNNVDYIVKYWISKGLQPSQINMGIPLYGKSWTLIEFNDTYTSDPTLPAPGLGPGAAGPLTGQAGYLGYNEICKFVKTGNWEVVKDPTYVIGPYASSPTVPKTWVGYDDAAMASVKSLYVLDKGLGGAMVWDISTDDFRNTCGDGLNPIMTTISRTVLTDPSSSTTISSTTSTGVSSSTTSSSTTISSTASAGVSSSTTSSSTTISSTASTVVSSSASTIMSSSSTPNGITTTTENSITTTTNEVTQTEGTTGTTPKTPTTRHTTEARTTVPTTPTIPTSATTPSNGGRINPQGQTIFLVFVLTLTLFGI